MTDIPFLGVAYAGFPSPAQDYYDGPINLNEHLLKNPTSTFIMRVQGDSMEGAGIFDGDEILVDRSIDPKDNLVVVAMVEGEMFVKRLRTSNGTAFLVSDNPKYRPIQIDRIADFSIWGVVITCIHHVK